MIAPGTGIPRVILTEKGSWPVKLFYDTRTGTARMRKTTCLSYITLFCQQLRFGLYAIHLASGHSLSHNPLLPNDVTGIPITARCQQPVSKSTTTPLSQEVTNLLVSYNAVSCLAKFTLLHYQVQQLWAISYYYTGTPVFFGFAFHGLPASLMHTPPYYSIPQY